MDAIKSMASLKASKAFVAAFLAAISSATIAAPDGFTTVEILAIVSALFLTFQATYWTTNAGTEPDGTIDVVQPMKQGDVKTYSLNLNSDPENLDQKDQVVFKINK